MLIQSIRSSLLGAVVAQRVFRFGALLGVAAGVLGFGAAAYADDPALHGRPRDFEVTVRNIQINSGAGFLVVLTGAIMRMPGLPREPKALQVRLLPDGTIEGIG